MPAAHQVSIYRPCGGQDKHIACPENPRSSTSSRRRRSSRLFPPELADIAEHTRCQNTRCVCGGASRGQTCIAESHLSARSQSPRPCQMELVSGRVLAYFCAGPRGEARSWMQCRHCFVHFVTRPESSFSGMFPVPANSPPCRAMPAPWPRNAQAALLRLAQAALESRANGARACSGLLLLVPSGEGLVP